MFESTVLDVAVGLVFAFLAVSLAASAIVEVLASIGRWRAASLLAGIKQLLNDDNFDKLAKTLYGHALVNPLEAPGQNQGKLGPKPSYIDPKQFADAMLQAIDIVKGAPDELKAKIDANALLDAQLKQLLEGIVDRTAGQADAMRNELAIWFDNAMDRVSGAYKRKTQLYLFLIALAMTLVLNVDAIQLASVLWHQPLVTKNLAIADGQDLERALTAIETMHLPIGWTTAKLSSITTGANGLYAILGWLISSVATLFGAPFWFDTLQTFVRLKGAGPSPTEKKNGAAASA